MISVVIPARDEAASVGRVVRDVARALAGEVFEVVVVDDGSCDGTGGLAEAAGARVVRLAGLGYGAALKAGVRAAGGSLVAFIDADGSYPAEALGRLVAAVRGGARMAVGARPAASDAESRARSRVKALLRWAVWRLGGVRVPDLNSGLRVLRVADFRALEPLLPERFSLTTTLTLALAAEGADTAFVPVTYHPRAGTSKWRPVGDTLRMARVVARGITWLRRGRTPLPERVLLLRELR